MGIKLGNLNVIAFKGDYEPVHMTKGNTKVTGWRRELLSGTELSFYNTYKDSVSITVEGNTVLSAEEYREKIGKSVVVPADEHVLDHANKVVVSGDTVQASDWYAKDGLSSQYQDTKVMGKNLVNPELLDLGDWKFGATTVYNMNDANARNVGTILRLSTSKPIKIAPSTAYSFKNFSSVTKITTIHVFYYDNNGNYLNAVNYANTTFGGLFTTPSNAEFMTFFSMQDITVDDLELIRFNFMLALGTYSTHEPYKDTVKSGLVMELSGRNFFNNPPTTTLQDRSGNGNVGTATGFAYTNASGSDGNGGIVFDGADDLITLPNVASVKPTTSVTVDFVINVSDFMYGTTEWSLFGCNPAYGWRVWKYSPNVNGTNTAIVFEISYKSGSTVRRNVDLPVSTYLPLNTDVRFTFTFNGTTGEIVAYKNGTSVLNYTREIGDIVYDAYAPNLGGIMKFNLKDFRLYNRALSDSEVYQNHFAGTSLNIPSPTDASPVTSNLPAGTYKHTSTDGIYEFTLPEELRGIGSTIDKVVFDRVSHQGYLERRCGNVLLNGDESWASAIGLDSTPYYKLLSQAVTCPDAYEFFCSHFGKADAYYSTASSGIQIFQSSLYIRSKDLTSVALLNTWLQTNNVTIIYKLLSTTRTSLTFTKVSSSSKTEVPMAFLTSTPSLEYPAQVWDVLSSKVASRGKNIVDGSKFQNYRPDTVSTWDGTSLTITGLWYDQVLIKVKPNTNYRLSYTHSGAGRNGTGIWTTYDGKTIVSILTSTATTFNSGSNTQLLLLLYSGSGVTNTSIYSNIQVEEGSVITPYESYKGRVENTLPTLRKIGSIADTYNPVSGEHVKRISDWQILDGSKGWLYHYSVGELHQVYLPYIFPINTFKPNNHPASVFKYNSVQLLSGESVINECSFLGAFTEHFYIRLPQNESGFSKNLSPTSSEIKAYFNGYKMCNADGTSPYYKSEAPYTPSTWAEWSKNASTVSGNSLTITGTGNNWGVQVMLNTTPKALTKYGFLYNVVSTTLVNSFLTGYAFSYKTLPKAIGNNKVVLTSISDTTTHNQQIQFGSATETGAITIKDIRIFELPVGSQIETDFNTLTADQLSAKYTFNGLCAKNWKRITDNGGQTNVLPTASYEGYTPYKMIYQLAEPVVTYLEPIAMPLYDGDTYFETDSIIAQPDITVGYQLPDGATNITGDITAPHPEYPSDHSGVGDYDAINGDYDVELHSSVNGWTPASEDIQYNTPTNNTFKTKYNFPVQLNSVGDISDEYTPPFWGSGYAGDGRNLVPQSMKTYAGSASAGITPTKLSSNELQVDVVAGNGNWHTSWWSMLDGVEGSFAEGDSFTISFLMKANVAGSKIPDIYIKAGMGYFVMTGSLTTEYSQVSYSGKWKKLNGLTPHLGWNSCSGTYFIKAWKIEKGSSPTPWTPSSGEFVQRVGKKVFDGTEALSDTAILGNIYRYGTNGFTSVSTPNGLSSHFPFVANYSGNYVHFYTHGNMVYMFHTQPTVTSFKAWLAKQYADGNPVTVYYILNTPILTTITGSALPTFYPHTKVESITDGIKPKLSGTARVIDLLETEF